MKKLLRKLVPKKLILFYHYLLALTATILYGFPAKKMVVIGVTGTKGKTTTANFIWSCLSACGFKTGIISTANIRIGDKESLNYFHMTMPGRFAIQKLMKQMVKSGCKYCVIETTSEGLNQFRHIGVFYDIAVFTNLTPEHLSAHGGSFENYKNAKAKMFKSLDNKKVIDGKEIEKVIIANADSEHADFYLNNKADRKITYSIQNQSDNRATEITEKVDGISFTVNGDKFTSPIAGRFNAYNILPAIIICKLAGSNKSAIQKGLDDLKSIPGRMEFINESQDFKVMVDYAHEKQSITAILETGRNIIPKSGQVIILLGAEGGGRDKTKRSIMGELAAKKSDYLIVSNVDPYEDNPTEIVEDIAKVAEDFGMKRNENLFVIEDRRGGIRKALELAKKDDIVLITGKGAEQSITIGGVKYPWDDRTVVKEELNKLT